MWFSGGSALDISMSVKNHLFPFILCYAESLRSPRCLRWRGAAGKSPRLRVAPRAGGRPHGEAGTQVGVKAPFLGAFFCLFLNLRWGAWTESRATRGLRQGHSNVDGGWDLLSPALTKTCTAGAGRGSPATSGAGARSPEPGGARLASPRGRPGVSARNAGAGGAVSSRARPGGGSGDASVPAGPSWGAAWPGRRKRWRPWGITGRKPRSGSACWAGAGTGSMGSTGNCRLGPGGREGERPGPPGPPSPAVCPRAFTSGRPRAVRAPLPCSPRLPGLPALCLRRSPLAAVEMGVSPRRGSGASGGWLCLPLQQPWA